MSTGTPLTDAELQQMLIEARVSETEIMEYADGSLARSRRSAVRLALAKYPDLMELLEGFLLTRGPMVEAINAALERRPLDRLRHWLESVTVPPARSTPKRSMLSSLDLRALVPSFPTAIAAGCAALAAVVLTAGAMGQRMSLLGERMDQMARDFVPPDKQGMPAPPSVHQALESTPMGSSARIAQDVSVTPELTFPSRHGTWCRQFGMTFGDRGVWVGQIACRDAEGIWRVRHATEPLRLRGDFQLVQGEEGAGVLAKARDELKAGEVLGVEEETPLIARRWQKVGSGAK